MRRWQRRVPLYNVGKDFRKCWATPSASAILFCSEIYLRTSRGVSRLLRLRKEHVKDVALENVGPRLPLARECLARKTTSVPAEMCVAF